MRHTITEVEEFPPKFGLCMEEGAKFEHPGLAVTILPCRGVIMPIDVQVQLGAVYGEACIGVVDSDDRILSFCHEKTPLVRQLWGQVHYHQLSSLFKAWLHVWSMSVSVPLKVSDVGSVKCKGKFNIFIKL